jgi:hypothetical protein
MTSLAEGVIKSLTVCHSIKRQLWELREVRSSPTAVDVVVLVPPMRPLNAFAGALQVDSERSAGKVTALSTSVHCNPATRCITREPTTEHLNLSPELSGRQRRLQPETGDAVKASCAHQTIEGAPVDDKVKEDSSASPLRGGAIPQCPAQRKRVW